MDYEDLSRFRIVNHLPLYVTVSIGNGVTAILLVAGIVHLLINKTLLKKRIYQLYLVSLYISFISNITAIFRYSEFLQEKLGLLIAINFSLISIITVIYIALLQMWYILKIYSVIDPWLEKILIPVFWILTGIVVVEYTMISIGIYIVWNDVYVALFNTIHLCYFMVFGSVVVITCSSSLLYWIKALSTFHSFNRGLKTELTHNLYRIIGAGIFLICCSITALFFDFSIFFEIVSLEIIFMSIFPSILVRGFQDSIKLVPFKKKRPEKNVLLPDTKLKDETLELPPTVFYQTRGLISTVLVPK